jgi:hypothetical protein
MNRKFSSELSLEAIDLMVHFVRNKLSVILLSSQAIHKKYELQDPLIDGIEESIEEIKSFFVSLTKIFNEKEECFLELCCLKTYLEDSLGFEINWEGDSLCMGFSQDVLDWFIPFCISSLQGDSNLGKVWVWGNENKCYFSLDKDLQENSLETYEKEFRVLLIASFLRSNGIAFETLSKRAWKLSFPKTSLA